MRILLDENVPKRLKRFLLGHDVLTVQKMGWRSLKNGALLDAADPLFDILLTIDKDMPHQQNLAGRKISIVVLASKFTRLQSLLPLMPELDRQLRLLAPGSGKLITIAFP